MAVECWYSAAEKYIIELAELGCQNLIFYRGATARKRLNMHAIVNEYMGPIEWQALMVGHQGAALLDKTHTIKQPKAVFPVWSYKNDSFNLLEEYCKINVGEDPDWYESSHLPPDERPVKGQEHRIIIGGVRITAREGFIDSLWSFKEQYPTVKFHVMDCESYSVNLLGPFDAASNNCFKCARFGRLILPNGKQVNVDSCFEEEYKKYRYWFNLIDGTRQSLKTNRDFCFFNMRSWAWACKFFTEDTLQQRKTRTIPSVQEPVDSVSPEAKYIPPQVISRKIGTVKWPILASDKIACNYCSLTAHCKYYREGSVCAVPGTDARKLADLFKRRDHGSLIEAMGNVLSIQAQRLENKVTAEELADEGETDPEITRIVKSLLDGGEKLAKLANPELFRPSTSVTTNILNQGGVQQGLGQASPKQIIANAVRELQATGIPIEKIDEALVTSYIAGEVIIADGQLAITGNVPEEEVL